VTNTEVAKATQSPGLALGVVVCVRTAFEPLPLDGVNAPVNPAPVHAERAADTSIPTMFGTTPQVGGGGAVVVTFTDAVMTRQSPGMEAGFVVCDWTRLTPGALDGSSGPVNPFDDHAERAFVTVRPARSGTVAHGVGVGVGVGEGVGEGVGAGGHPTHAD
jgi:hypothetical protein